MAEDWISTAHVDLEGLWESAAFRLHQAYEVEVGPRWRLELDRQPYGEVWLIRGGRCAVELGQERALAGPGEVVVLRPGRARLSANGAAGPLSLVGFGCSVTRFGAIDLLAELELPLVIRRPPERLRRLIARTARTAHGGHADRVFRARALAELALAELVQIAHVDLAAGGEPPAVRPEVGAALTYIAAHFHEPLDLAAIARAVHLSPKHLSRRFRESLGIPPIAYLRRYRLDWARERIATTELPIIAIALDAGFKDAAHFSRAFRAEHGVSPRALREHARSLRANVRSLPANSRASA